MVDYLEAIKRPFSNLKKSGLAAIFIWIPIVNFLSNGYFLECAKVSMQNKKELPEWTNFKDKFVRGFLFIVINLLYFIPLVIISILLIGNVLKEIFDNFFINAFETGNIANIMPKIINMLLEPSIIGYFIVIVILGILIGYIVPMASLHYVINWNFKEAFNFREIFKKAFTKQYFFAFLVVSIYSVLLSSILGFIPFIGSIIASALAGISGYSIYGSVYKEIKV